MRTRFPDPADAWTDDDARAALEEWRRSGDSIAAVARKHGVTAARLYWWRKKLRMTASTTTATLSLVPASIVGESESESVMMTIRLLGEVAVEVAHASPSWVAQLVAELTRPLP